MHQRLRLGILEAEPSIWQHGEIVEAEIKLYPRSTFSLSTTTSNNTNTKRPHEYVEEGEVAVSLTDLTLVKNSSGVRPHAKGLPVLQRLDDKLALRDVLLSIQRRAGEPKARRPVANAGGRR